MWLVATLLGSYWCERIRILIDSITSNPLLMISPILWQVIDQIDITRLPYELVKHIHTFHAIVECISLCFTGTLKQHSSDIVNMELSLIELRKGIWSIQLSLVVPPNITHVKIRIVWHKLLTITLRS